MIARGVHFFWRLILFPCSLHQDEPAYLEVDRVYSFLTCDRTLAYLREVAESDTRDEQDPNTITKRAHATSSQATVQTRRVTLAAQPEYPPPFFRLRRSSPFREFFTEESDSELWAALMQGETNISAKAMRKALFLRLEDTDLPAEMSSWTLQTYLKLKFALGIGSWRQNGVLTQQDIGEVLRKLEQEEDRQIQRVVSRVRGENLNGKFCQSVIERLWCGTVVGQSTNEIHVNARELWRCALATSPDLDALRAKLRHHSAQFVLFDSAWIAEISHSKETRHWSLRMHCRAAAAYPWQEIPAREEVVKAINEIEQMVIKTVAVQWQNESESLSSVSALLRRVLAM